MTTLIYDSTFEGLMTAVFEVFEYKYDAVEIIAKKIIRKKISSQKLTK